VLMRTSKDVERMDVERTDRPSSGWARVREWFGRLLGRGARPAAPARPAPRSAAKAKVAPPVPVDEPPGRGVARLTADELALVRKDLRHVLDQHADSRRSSSTSW